MDPDSPIGKMIVAAAVGGVMAIVYISIRISYNALKGITRTLRQPPAPRRSAEGGGGSSALTGDSADNWLSRQNFPALIVLAFLAGILAATLFFWRDNSFEACMLSKGRDQPRHLMHYVQVECQKRFPKDARDGPWTKYQAKASATSRSKPPPIPEGFRLVDPSKAAK